MHAVVRSRRRRRSAQLGFATAIPVLVAAVSAIMLMSACHSTPGLAASLRAAPAEDVASACDVACSERATGHLAAFDEHFYTPPVDDAEQD